MPWFKRDDVAWRVRSALVLVSALASGCIMTHPDNPFRQKAEWIGVDARLGDADDLKTQVSDGPVGEEALGGEGATLTGVFTGDLEWRPGFGSNLRAAMNFNRIEFAQREAIPWQASHEGVLDIATLTRREPETCVAVTVQNERSYDRAFEQMNPEIHIDGELVEGWRIEQEAASDMQLWYTVRFYIVFTTERLFDVVSRHAVLCVDRAARASVELKLENDLYPLDPTERWTLRFRWELTDPNLKPLPTRR